MKWLRSLWSRRGGAAARPSAPARRRARPALEGLEDRCLLASSIFEFPVPSGNIPQQIVPGPDGALWFTELGVNRVDPNDGRDFIGRITPDGRVTEFPLPPMSALPGQPITPVQPFGITLGSDNNLYFTMTNISAVGRISAGGAISIFSIPSGATPGLIAGGPDQAVWFTEPEVNRIGRLDFAGRFSEFTLPTANSLPTGITTGADGAIWFTEPGTNRIGRVAVAGVAISEFNVPTPNADPTDITLAPDGSLWFTETVGNQIGRISNGSVVTEFFLPVANSQPSAITNAPDGNLYFIEKNTNTIRSISNTGVFGPAVALPEAGSDPQEITFGPHSVWVTQAGPADQAQKKISVLQVGLDANHAYIQALYRDELGRLGTDQELDVWVVQLVQHGLPAVAFAIEHSPEARNLLVTNWYGQYLGRPPVGNEQSVWVNLLLAGATEEQVLAGILGSNEFLTRAQTLIQAGDANTRFVAAVYSLALRRGGDPSEYAFWVGKLPTLGRNGVAQAILGSAEYRRLTVVNYYRLLLNRTTLARPEEVGFWVGSGLPLDIVRQGFESSPEYFSNG
jgi:virginiamycin B lyase